MNKIRRFVDFLMDKVSELSILDFALMKMALISFGVIIGAFFSKFFRKFQAIFWFFAIFSYIYLIYKIFFRDKNYFSRSSLRI
ncbi:MAG: hypothetical protein Q8878_05085 [Bacillota bacterium]|nr:hypothetical protein [Bacillota bacterium]